MRDIRASVEVRALIGAEKLRELHGKAFAQYEYWQCGGEARTTKGVTWQGGAQHEDDAAGAQAGSGR
jgi:hypothetical protein